MKTNLTYSSAIKQQELADVITLIRQYSEVEMIIFFADKVQENCSKNLDKNVDQWSDQNNFNLLVIIETTGQFKQSYLEREITKTINSMTSKTPISVIVHDLEFVNHRLAREELFFPNTQAQGMVLYDSGKFTNRLYSSGHCQLVTES